MSQNVDQTDVADAKGSTTYEETTAPDGTVVERRPVQVDNTDAATEPPVLSRTELARRYGGIYWGSDFIGFAVALFFTIVFLAIVSAAVGYAGYQLGQPLPRIGHSVSTTSQHLGIGALIGSLVAIFLAYVIGGYTAGRMARFSGVANGVGVVIWTVIVAIVLGVVGAVLGTNFNAGSSLHLNISQATATGAGVVSVIVTLVVMLLGGMLGGSYGARYHRAIDQDAGIAA